MYTSGIYANTYTARTISTNHPGVRSTCSSNTGVMYNKQVVSHARPTAPGGKNTILGTARFIKLWKHTHVKDNQAQNSTVRWARNECLFSSQTDKIVDRHCASVRSGVGGDKHVSGVVLPQKV